MPPPTGVDSNNIICVGVQVSLAIEATQQHWLSALGDLAERLAGLSDPGEVAGLALDRILLWTTLNEGIISLVDRQRDELVVLARRGPLSPLLEANIPPSPRTSDRVTAQVARDGVPFVCNDIHASDTVPDSTRLLMETVGASALICLPLALRGDILGVLTLLGTRPS